MGRMSAARGDVGPGATGGAIPATRPALPLPGGQGPGCRAALAGRAVRARPQARAYLLFKRGQALKLPIQNRADIFKDDRFRRQKALDIAAKEFQDGFGDKFEGKRIA